jgi:hypothetical protein
VRDQRPALADQISQYLRRSTRSNAGSRDNIESRAPKPASNRLHTPSSLTS